MVIMSADSVMATPFWKFCIDIRLGNIKETYIWLARNVYGSQTDALRNASISLEDFSCP